MFGIIKNVLGSLLYIIMFFFAGLQACSTIVITNSKINTQEDRINFLIDHRVCFEQLAVSGFDETAGADYGLGRTNVHTIERKTKVRMDDIEDCVKDDMRVYYRDDDDYVVVYFNTAPVGFSDSGVYYSKNGVSLVPESGTLTEYDASIDKNVAYFTSSYVEVYQIDEHWFYFQKAFYNNDGFRRKSN